MLQCQSHRDFPYRAGLITQVQPREFVLLVLQVEEEISNMGFPRTSIYRPGVLLTSTPRPETRAVEAALQFMTKYLDLFRLVSIETSVVAKAIVRNSVRSSDSPLEVLSNRDMLNIGKNKN